MKRCACCYLDKPTAEFYRFRGKPTARCIECIKARRKELRAQHSSSYKHTRINNRTGARGVTIVKRKDKTMYRAKAALGKKRIHLGYYSDVLDAICAASDFRIKHDLNK